MKLSKNKTVTKGNNLRKLIREQYAQSKFSFWAYMILRLIIIAILVFSLVNARYENLPMCIISLTLFSMPPIYERKFNADFPTLFELMCLFMVFASQILGEIGCFYIKFPFWDGMLHTVGGFLFAAFGFSLVDLFSKDPNLKFKIPPACMAIYSFSVSMAISAIWEFFECGMDYFFGKDMQKDTIINSFQSVMLDSTNSNIPVPVTDIHEVTINGTYTLPFDGYLDIGLLDTMKDLTVCALGALVFGILAFAYVSTKGNNKLAAMFIPVRRNWEEDPPEGHDKKEV